MRRVYQIAGTSFLVLSILVIWGSIHLHYYTSLGPGPGFFPFWLAVILAMLSCLMIYHGTVHESKQLPDEFLSDRGHYARFFVVLFCLMFSVVSMETLGFRITMLCFLSVLMLTFDRVHPLVIAAIAIAGSFGVYHIFTQYLMVYLPVGVLGV